MDLACNRLIRWSQTAQTNHCNLNLIRIESEDKRWIIIELEDSDGLANLHLSDNWTREIK